MIETRAPGKLFVAGEYAVVDAGEPAVLIAVDRFIHVRLTEERKATAAPESAHVRAAMSAVEGLRAERGIEAKHYSFDISSELQDDTGRKFGLGSSAAVTVAVVAALNELYALRLSSTERFRLALIATIEVSPKASGGDLAASTFGGWIRYSSPDRVALGEVRAARGVGEALTCGAWERCSISRLPDPTQLELLVGWTGTPASTERLVNRVRAGEQASRDAADAAQQHAQFLKRSRACVDRLTSALRGDDTGAQGAQGAIREARGLLQGLALTSGIEIETEMLGQLCDIAERHSASGKPSGAGGGDCGIVLAGPDCDTDAISREWQSVGIQQLSLTVQPVEGVIDER